MEHRARGSAQLALIILVAGIVLAVANVAVLLTTRGTLTGASLAELSRQCLPCLLYFIAAPVLAAIVLALSVRGLTPPAAHVALPESKPTPPPPPSPAPALRLLALLQREARLVDFIQEDIDAYGDAQIGAAVRSIHAGCRKALHERIQLQRIYAQEDGSEVAVEAGFDPGAVRLTGNVAGEPPFRGTLQHGGWRATTVSLPEPPGNLDPTIIAPAEVEIP